MKALRRLAGAIGLASITIVTLSFIDPGAPSASHAMDNAAAAIHDYLHHAGYPSSYGAHALDEGSAMLHSDLHGWQNGTVTEAQIAADWAALESSWKTFNVMIHSAEILNQGDDTLDALFLDVKDAYKTLRHLMIKVEG